MNIKSRLRLTYRGLVLGYNPIAWIGRRFVSRNIRVLFPQREAAPTVVDFGAGIAPYRPIVLRHLPAARYLALEFAPSATTDIVCDITKVPIATGSTDLVFCFEVLQHIPSPPAVLAEMARVLRPGGFGLITLPFLYAECDARDFHRWTLEGIRADLEAQGLNVLSCLPRGRLFFLLGALLGSFVPILFPRAKGWRSGGALSAARNVVINLLVLPFQTLGWIGLLLDKILPIRGAYMGSMVVFQRRECTP